MAAQRIPTRLSSFTPRLLIAPSGDVVILSSANAVARLAGDSGQLRWLRDFGTPLVLGAAFGSSEDVIVDGQRRSGLYVARLAGDTGRARWQRTLLSGRPANGSAGEAVTLDGNDNVVVAGELASGRPRPGMTTSDFGVLKLCGRTGRARTARCGAH